MAHDFWRLPAGVDDVLPPQARQLELLRRAILDLFHSWGYDYVEPPMVEYLDALLVGNDLNLQTLKVADQASGRTLGVRADITSQAARIDANSLRGDGVRRLCYAGAIVRARAPGVMESRVPLKAGAEIYGSTAISADLEIMCLAIDALRFAGVEQPVIELGHVGFVQALVAPLALSVKASAALMEAVRIKSEADIRQVLRESGSAGDVADDLCRLVRLMGGKDVLATARSAFASAPAVFHELIEQLELCATELELRRPGVTIRFDVSEPVGFGYHKALVFALYDREHGRALARGGRYDGIGEQFGSARPATGFDLNLKSLNALTADAAQVEEVELIWLPWQPRSDARQTAQTAARELRASGARVIAALAATDVRPAACHRELIVEGSAWRLTQAE